MEENYERIIAIQERSAGNESVGSMWLETRSFEKSTPVSLIVDWAHKLSGGTGKLIITIDRGES